MLKLSYILPCYNVAPYIGRCIESIESQDIPQTEYEVICVDDCSKDNTVEVIKEYQKQYANIRLVQHAVNQTAGGARNTGIKEAKGEYLWFVDPDDAIFPNVLQILITKLAKSEVEILFFNYQTQNESGDTINSKYPLFEGERSGLEYISKYANGTISVFTNIYSCVFLREFILENKISYPRLRAGQDVVFIWETIICSKRCGIIDDVCYKYIRRSDSVTGSKGKYSARAIMSQSLLFAIEIDKLLEQYQIIDTSIIGTLENAVKCAMNDDSRMILLAEYPEQKRFYEMLKVYSDSINKMHPFMNRKTRNIFRRYSGLFLVWLMVVRVYKIASIIKEK